MRLMRLMYASESFRMQQILRPGRHSEQLWISTIAQNGVLVEGFAVFSLLRVPQVAQNDVLVKGFGVFGALHLAINS